MPKNSLFENQLEEIQFTDSLEEITNQLTRAASHAPYFISLVSPTYFDSPYCRKEIAHSARSGNRVIRVNIEPVPNAPNDMTWVDNPNWLNVKGEGNGLSPELEEALQNAVNTPRGENIVDLREQACLFLLNQKTRQEIIRLWNQLRMHTNFGEIPGSNPTAINYILQEASGVRLDELCNALAPQ